MKRNVERARASSRWGALAVLSGVATFAVAQGCVEGLTAAPTVDCPPFEDFKKVSPLLEQRCGTLDCHGNTARPLRLYGQYGLRFNPDDEDEDLYTGNLGSPTTAEEVERNYFAVCGLEPEKMEAVTSGQQPPDSLTLVRKPRLTEKHKGGRIWNEGKVEDRCVVGWIQADYEEGAMPPEDCADALAD
ncbi:MAG: hypothetical protein HOW73_39270 [Polyangiaceae bacterium]|nr:hypothetical protein [Polyangiaceae bacterium]